MSNSPGRFAGRVAGGCAKEYGETAEAASKRRMERRESIDFDRVESSRELLLSMTNERRFARSANNNPLREA